MARLAVKPILNKTFAVLSVCALALLLALSSPLGGGGQAYAAEGGDGSITAAKMNLAPQASKTITIANANTGKVTLKVGGKYKLGAKASSGKLQYKSSKPKVAKVTKTGQIKALKKGKATITVTIKGTKVSKKVKVTVVKKSAYKNVKSIASKIATNDLKVGESASIATTFKPAKASNKNLKYASSNSKVATVSAEGVVTAVAAGKAKVTVTSCANSKATSSVSVTVTDPGTGPSVDPRNSGVADTSLAARGQDTPGLATLQEAHETNQLNVDLSTRPTTPTISKSSASFMATTDYMKDISLMVEVLRPSNANASSTPLLVWINGDTFTDSDPGANLQLRLAIAKKGFVVASVQHRVSARTSFPTPLQDVKAAIRYLKAHSSEYRFNKNMVAVGGDSAGGYLATMVGVTSNMATIQWPGRNGALAATALDVGDNLGESSAVNAVVDFYGLSDLTLSGAGFEEQGRDNIHKSDAASEAVLINGASAGVTNYGVFNEIVKSKVVSASPLTYIDANVPPFFIVHGANDFDVSPVASKMLQDRLEAAGVVAERTVIANAGHGGAEFYQDAVIDKVAEFLSTHATQAVSTDERTTYDEAAGTLLDYETGAYLEDANVPTFENSTADSVEVAVDTEKWAIEQSRDITYKSVKTNGTYTNLTMNMLLPSRPGDTSKRPVLFCAACGAFTQSNPEYAMNNYLRYAELGYIVAVAEVRIPPTGVLPEPIQDGKAAIRWLRAHAAEFNLNPNCIMAIGDSAGGYFASILGVLGNTTHLDADTWFDVGDNLEYSSALQGVIDLYGISDLTIVGAGLGDEIYDSHRSPSLPEAMLLNGLNPGGSILDPANFDKAAKYSPFSYIDKDDPPYLMFHGTVDELVSPVSTMEFCKRLNAAGATATRYSVVGAGHGGQHFQTKDFYDLVDQFMAQVAESNK